MLRLFFIAVLPSLGLSAALDSQPIDRSDPGRVTDRQIVAMGHKAWIQKTLSLEGNSVELLEEAERRFSWAQTIANEKVIKGRPNAKDLDDLQILMANISKSSFVIGDYMTLDKPYDHLYIAKSISLAALALRDVLANVPAAERLKESDVLALLEETRNIHESQSKRLEAFRARKGGFSHQQLMLEYNRMSSMMRQTLDAKAVQTANQKQHILKLCRNLIQLTLGKDPLPY
jgi:hypothetical protein